MADIAYKGLTDQQAQEALQKHGYNVTQEGKKVGFFKKFVSQFGDLMIVILLVSAVLSFVMAIVSGDSADFAEPIIIVAIVIANALLGTIQEYRAEQSLQKLKLLTSPRTRVVRDGKVMEIDSKIVVPNDVCIFASGDVVTADCKLLFCESLFVNESALTGESVPVEKQTSHQNGVKSKVFCGSLVTKGRCFAQVTATGKHTQLGKIADMLSDTQQSLTPLQQRLKHLSQVVGVVCIAVCVCVLVIGFVKGAKQMSPTDTLTSVFVNVFLTSVSLAAAAIPEGLPAVVTVVLANGISKMAQKNAVVKRLTAVEALGSATVICTDKTGTLTQNKMTLQSVFDGKRIFDLSGVDKQSDLLQKFCWCSDVAQNDKGVWLGDPSEVAVASVTKRTRNAVRLYEIPFDSARKLMTVVVKWDGAYYCVTKGSLDAMKHADNYDKFVSQYVNYAKRGLRVFALASKRVQHTFARSKQLEEQLHVDALFALADPPRSEAGKAVQVCKCAGIRPVMITGDSVETACEIASTLGIKGKQDVAVDGETLAQMTDKELSQRVDKIAVYARVSPQDKLRIVSAWQSVGAVVAMTGDGVNDAPALKKADIGCAMGSGTEVAKDSSDIILTDDNFATIVDAVSLGRSVYNNVKKSVLYLVTCNVGEVLFVFFALLLFNVSPLSALQLLWINLVTDGLPGLALGVYKQEKDVMQVAPKGKDETFFSGKSGKQVAVGGVSFAVATLVAYLLGNKQGYAYARTMAFLVLSLSQLVFVLEMRCNKGIFSGEMTPFMAFSFALSVALVVVVATVPSLRQSFGLKVLSGKMYVWAILLSFAPTLAHEACRWFSPANKER